MLLMMSIMSVCVSHSSREYSGIFYICQRCVFWSDPDSPGFHKENKKKIIKIGLLLAK